MVESLEIGVQGGGLGVMGASGLLNSIVRGLLFEVDPRVTHALG